MSAVLLLAVLYGPHDAEDYIHIASKAEAALYNGWSRTAWSLGLGYIMIACCLGRGGKNCLIYIHILNQCNFANFIIGSVQFFFVLLIQWQDQVE